MTTNYPITKMNKHIRSIFVLLLLATLGACGGGPKQSQGSFTSTGSMKFQRSYHTETLLKTGMVLVAGGVGSGTSAELYDPVTGSWSMTGSMNTARFGHTATLLQGWQGAGGGRIYHKRYQCCAKHDQRRNLRSADGFMDFSGTDAQAHARATRLPCCRTARCWWRAANRQTAPVQI